MKLEQNNSTIRITIFPLIVLCALVLASPEELSEGTHHFVGWTAIILVAGAVIALLTSILSTRMEHRPSKIEAAISLASLLAIGISAAAVHFDWASQAGVDKKEPAQSHDLHMPPVFPPGMSRRPANAAPMARPMQSARAPSPLPQADAPRAVSPASDAQRPSDERLEAGKEIDGLLARAAEAQKKKKFDDAEKLYSSALSLIDSTFPDTLDKRGPVAATLARTLFGAGKVQEAVSVIDDHLKRLELNPSQDFNITAQFHDLAGTFLGNSNRFEESIVRFKKSLKLKSQANSDPADIASTYAKIAISHARLNNKEEAGAALKESKKLLEANAAPDDESLKRIESIATKYGLSL